MTIAVCLKWINASGQTEVDDDRFMGFSYADQAALEYALISIDHLRVPPLHDRLPKLSITVL